MATFVLVHGAWSGAHGFRHIRKLLQQAGHEVFTPSLTGLGERAHLLSPQVNLTTHVRDVTNQVLYEDLNDIVLLGFSYGGFVVTGALEHIGSRISHLVYLDAFVPENGETVLAHIGRSGRAVAAIGESWTIPPTDRQFDDPEEMRWMSARRGPQPMACFTEAVYLSRPLEQFDFTRTYVKATLNPESDPGGKALWQAAAKAKQSRAWVYREIETTHMIPSNRPTEIAELLADLVR